MRLIVEGGDKVSGFEEIYRRYFKDVFLFLKGLTKDEHLAEELTEETFFKALEAVDSFQGECDIRVWLCQIAKNLYFSYLRKNKKQLSLEEQERRLNNGWGMYTAWDKYYSCSRIENLGLDGDVDELMGRPPRKRGVAADFGRVAH